VTPQPRAGCAADIDHRRSRWRAPGDYNGLRSYYYVGDRQARDTAAGPDSSRPCVRPFAERDAVTSHRRRRLRREGARRRLTARDTDPDRQYGSRPGRGVLTGAGARHGARGRSPAIPGELS